MEYGWSWYWICESVEHPHIRKLCEVYEDNKGFKLVIEPLEGKRLFDKIKRIDHWDLNPKALISVGKKGERYLMSLMQGPL